MSSYPLRAYKFSYVSPASPGRVTQFVADCGPRPCLLIWLRFLTPPSANLHSKGSAWEATYGRKTKWGDTKNEDFVLKPWHFTILDKSKISIEISNWIWHNDKLLIIIPEQDYQCMTMMISFKNFLQIKIYTANVTNEKKTRYILLGCYITQFN